MMRVHVFCWGMVFAGHLAALAAAGEADDKFAPPASPWPRSGSTREGTRRRRLGTPFRALARKA